LRTGLRCFRGDARYSPRLLPGAVVLERRGGEVGGLLRRFVAIGLLRRGDDVFALGLAIGFVRRAGDIDLHRGRDFRVQAHADIVEANGLDRLVEHDRAALDLAARLDDLVGDIARGDRTIELARFAGLTDQHVGRAVDLARSLLRVSL